MKTTSGRLAVNLLNWVPRKRISWAMGEAAAWNLPATMLESAIAVYSQLFGVDMASYEVPSGGFRSFDDFFTRRLSPGARSICEDRDAIVSPCDGRLESCGSLAEDQLLRVKNQDYSAANLLGSRELADRFAGGGYAVIYLAPGDYHRVHASREGQVERVKHIPGTLFPVNELGSKYVEGLLCRNERMAIFQKHQSASVCTVMVGAIGVGRISLSFDPGVRSNSNTDWGDRNYEGFGRKVMPGDELGTFHLGSTVVLLLDAHSFAEWEAPAGERVRMGQRLGQTSGHVREA